MTDDLPPLSPQERRDYRVRFERDYREWAVRYPDKVMLYAEDDEGRLLVLVPGERPANAHPGDASANVWRVYGERVLDSATGVRLYQPGDPRVADVPDSAVRPGTVTPDRLERGPRGGKRHKTARWFEEMAQRCEADRLAEAEARAAEPGGER